LVAVILTVASLAPAAAAYGAVATKSSPDPCALITSAAAGALANPYTVESTDSLSKKNCLYQLQGTGSNEGTSDPVNLFVDSLSDYKLNKVLIHKAKAVKGLGVAGYSGVDGAGQPVVAFKTKKQAIRLTGGLDAATLIALAKSFASQVK
jgi:glutamate dehydrogenase/leucine dehydrogenase